MGHVEGVTGGLVLEGHPHHHLGPQLPVHLLWSLQILHMHHSFFTASQMTVKIKVGSLQYYTCLPLEAAVGFVYNPGRSEKQQWYLRCSYVGEISAASLQKGGYLRFLYM